MKIACIGEAMIEVALTGQTGAAQVGFAGDVLNTAIYLRRALPAVHEVAFVSMIGRDSLSDQMATFIAAEGISIAHLSRHPTLVPGLYTIATDVLGERSFAYWRDTSAARQMFRDPAALQPLLGFDFIYLSAITLAILPDPARQALFDVLTQFRAKGALWPLIPTTAPVCGLIWRQHSAWSNKRGGSVIWVCPRWTMKWPCLAMPMRHRCKRGCGAGVWRKGRLNAGLWGPWPWGRAGARM